MDNKRNTAIAGVIILVIIFAISLNCYWLFAPVPPKITRPIPVMNKPIVGGTVILNMDMSPKLQIVGNATIQSGDDIFILPQEASVDSGRGYILVIYRLPDNIMQGKYRIMIHAIFKINLIKDKFITLNSAEFIVGGK